MKRFLLLFLSCLTLAGCGPHFDQVGADNFTALKEIHLDFIGDFTGTQGKTYDEAAVISACNRGVAEFGNAKEYLDSKKDQKAMKALITLRDQFDKDCRFLQNLHKLYSPTYAADHRAALTANYDHAIAAEYGSVKEIEE